jgi:serine/threonine protein kinase
MASVGGKVIGSGGFGCIFEPELKCVDDPIETRDKKYISKLMLTKYAYEEYNKIKEFKHVLKNIPNYEEYFLLDGFTICQPNKLTKSDLKGYAKRCKSLKKKKINSKNINRSLDQLSLISMPHGGVDLEKYIYNSRSLVELNNSLIQLLVHGVCKMNEMGVFHCDLKDGNILVQQYYTKLSTRIIDWGMSFMYTGDEEYPKGIYRRPFQYNVPFSSVLFNDEFDKLYNEFLLVYPEPSYYQVRTFIINYIFVWNRIRGPGHLSAINDINEKLFSGELVAISEPKIQDHIIEYDYTYYYIVEYLTKVVMKYTNKGKINMNEYFVSVFLKNVDIWGFVMIYVTIYEYIYSNYESRECLDKIKRIILTFLYENPTEPINVNKLVIELTKLSSSFQSLGTIMPKSRSKTVKSKPKKRRKTLKK